MRSTRWSLLVIVCGAAAHAQGVITTIAGADRLFPSSSLSGLQAPLGQTTGIALDALGNLYIADIGNNMVMRLSRDGTLVAVAGNGKAAFSGDGGPALKASLRTPVSVAVDSTGNLYIADELNHRIRKVSPDGTITTVAGNGTPGFSGDGGPAVAAKLEAPFDVKTDASGNLYIADSINQRVRKVSPAGIISTIAGNGTAGFSGDGGKAIDAALNKPLYIALDGSGSLYISDSANQRIRKVAPDGTIDTVAGNGKVGFTGDGGPAIQAALNGPAGLSLDLQGNVYIADSLNGRIRKISKSGIINTFAGNGIGRFSGDGGTAVAASLDNPFDVAVDATGNIWIADTNSRRVRRVSLDGNITTAAGNGGPFAGDGGPATGAVLNYPYGVALDEKGNLYVADTFNNRIRQIALDGTISTVAGSGMAGFSGDGGAAVNAQLNTPSGVALDSAGNIYIADTYNDRVRRVSTNGVITTVAGSGSTPGYSGDGGPAVAAVLSGPRGVAVQGSSVFIADSRNNRVRKIGANSVITTVAGTGAPDSVGDGGPAAAAALNNPAAVVVDAAGNLYIADTLNNRVRKVAQAGTITTIAGSGVPGFSGNGGPATEARFFYPTGVTVDPAGNLYIVDQFNCRVRKVATDGTVATFAGTGDCQSSGDGGLATSASLNYPYGIATDGAGNFFIADTPSGRIRKVLAPGVVIRFQATPTTLSFTANADGNAPGAQTVSLSSAVPGLVYSSAAQSSWLKISPSSGSIPASLNASADPAGLAPGTYKDTIVVTVPNATTPLAMIPVTLTLGAAQSPALSVDTTSLKFSAVQGGASPSGQIHVSNSGSGSLTFTSAAATTSGGSWLSVSPASGVVTPSSPATLAVRLDTSSLAPGTYLGSITLATATSTTTISVTLLVTAPQAIILLSQTGLSFRAAAGGTPLPQSFAILNTGQGSMGWSATATPLSNKGNWLRISPASGTLERPLLDVSQIQVSVDSSGLTPGDYYGRIDVIAAASNSPQTVTVVFTVVQPNEILQPEVQPTGLVFAGTAGLSPGSQDVQVGNPKALADNFLSSQIGTAFTYLPSSAQLPPGQPQTLRVYPDFTQLNAGTVQHGTITLQFADGTARTISVLTVVAPDASSSQQTPLALAERLAGECSATKLLPQFTQIAFASNVKVGYPAAVAVKVVDDCGRLQTDGSVVVSFSNGDAPLSLVNLRDGNWTNSWQPAHASAAVTLTAEARLPAQNLNGMVQASPLNLQQGSQTSPTLVGGPQGIGTLAAGTFAPGDLILLKGSNLANGQASSSSAPLLQQLAGASVVIGGRLASLLYADMGQLVGLVPADVPVNTLQQVLVQRDSSLGVPAPVIISTTHPAILTKDGSGQGQALIYKAVNGAATVLADASNPVRTGDTILIYGTGLGGTDANGNAANRPTVSIGGQAAPAGYAGIALTPSYPAGGAPTLLGVVSAGLGGLYQISATVPGGLPTGSASVLISSAGQTSQSGVTLATTGSTPANVPAIASINTAGGFPDIAQNDFIEIKGANLAPASVGPNGMTWDSAPEFARGQMPTQLAGVSVRVNGKPAFVYYVSATQLNVLTPLDSTTGPLQVVVINNGTTSAPFMVTLRAVAPSFLIIGTTKYILATHADGRLLVGPTSLSSPGYPFLPAQPGETIVMYAVGFGLPSSPLVNGSSSQTGTLPTLPMIQIGGVPATVIFAGVIGPGLYQLNVTVPNTVGNGDNAVLCTYGGLTTPSGDSLFIQR